MSAPEDPDALRLRQASAFQCNAPSKRRSGTCDRHLCASCATELGPDVHACPGHASGFSTVNEAPQKALFP